MYKGKAIATAKSLAANLALLMIAAGGIFSPQLLQGQDTSLGDLARKTRSERDAQQKQGITTSEETRELTKKLEEEQEAADTAPLGFKTYNAGEYRLWVPAPFEVEGRDGTGTVLASSPIGGVRALVMAGVPIEVSSTPTKAQLLDTAINTARQYSRNPQSVECWPRTIGKHPAHACTITYLIDQEVWGSGVFIQNRSSIVPVFCVAPQSQKPFEKMNDRHASYAERNEAQKLYQRQSQDVSIAFKACAQVFDSIQFKADIAEEISADGSPGLKHPKAVTAMPPDPNANGLLAAASSPNQPSLGAIAHQAQEPAPQRTKARRSIESVGDLNIPPSGFKNFSFIYGGNHERWDANLLVPADELPYTISDRHSFQVQVGKDSMFLMVGLIGMYSCCPSSTDPNLIHWQELTSNQNNGLKPYPADATVNTTTLDGKDALSIKFRWQKPTGAWISEQIRLESHGTKLVVGCLIPEKILSEAQDICSTFMESLRAP